MITVPLANIKEWAKDRPAGYMEDLLSKAARLTDSEAVFSEGAFQELLDKYVTQASPGLVDMAKNAAQAAGRWAVAGFPLTPPNELELRQVICGGGIWEGKQVPPCRHFRPDALVSNCALCGCNGIKLKWATESCPEFKWGAVKGP